VTRLLLVGAGGFVGSVLRWALATLVQDTARGSAFPWGTLAVNALGCLAIGALAQLAETRSAISPEVRLLLATGLLGGFTTFSAFGNETLDLLRADARWLAAANVLANVLLGLAAVQLGRVLASR
jgi:CrcB protein